MSPRGKVSNADEQRIFAAPFFLEQTGFLCPLIAENRIFESLYPRFFEFKKVGGLVEGVGRYLPRGSEHEETRGIGCLSVGRGGGGMRIPGRITEDEEESEAGDDGEVDIAELTGWAPPSALPHPACGSLATRDRSNVLAGSALHPNLPC